MNFLIDLSVCVCVMTDTIWYGLIDQSVGDNNGHYAILSARRIESRYRPTSFSFHFSTTSFFYDNHWSFQQRLKLLIPNFLEMLSITMERVPLLSKICSFTMQDFLQILLLNIVRDPIDFLSLSISLSYFKIQFSLFLSSQ